MSGAVGLAEYEFDFGVVVERRIGVGHAGNGGKAAGDGGGGTGGDGFLFLVTRLAKVNVHVDESGGDDEAGGVDDSVDRQRGRWIDADDAAVGDEQVGALVDGLRGVDDASALDENGLAHGFTEREFIISSSDALVARQGTPPKWSGLGRGAESRRCPPLKGSVSGQSTRV